MKHCLLFFILSLYLTVSKGSDTLSTNKRPARNIIKTDVVGYFNSIKSISYERVINNRHSIQVSYAFGEYIKSGEDVNFKLQNKTGSSFPNTNQKVQLNHHIKGEFRYYISHTRNLIPAGFHLGGSIEFNNLFESFYNVPDSDNYYGTLNSEYAETIIALNVGPQILIKRIITLDILVSPGLFFTSGTEEKQYGNNNQFGHSSEISGSGITISFSVSAGIAFGK